MARKLWAVSTSRGRLVCAAPKPGDAWLTAFMLEVAQHSTLPEGERGPWMQRQGYRIAPVTATPTPPPAAA